MGIENNNRIQSKKIMKSWFLAHCNHLNGTLMDDKCCLDIDPKTEACIAYMPEPNRILTRYGNITDRLKTIILIGYILSLVILIVLFSIHDNWKYINTI